MKLLFKQRLFSWFDSYDIYDEFGNTVYVALPSGVIIPSTVTFNNGAG